MLQKIITLLAFAVYVIITFYLIVFLSWLFFPLLLIAVIFFTWRYFQVRRLWNELLKQQTKTRKKRFHIASDDSIIDAEYEEIK